MLRPASWTERHPPARSAVTESGAAPVHRLAALAAVALDFTDATISLIDGTAHDILASTRAGGGAARDVADRLDRAVAGSGRPMAVEDLAGFLDQSELPLPATAEGAYLGVPLLSSDQVIGVLSVSDPAPRSIDARMVRLLVDFGAVVSDALDLRRTANPRGERNDGSSTELARAVADGEVLPWYQPIVDLTTRKAIGVEAWARWHHPFGGVEGAGSFILLAEGTDVIVDLDVAVIRRALTDLGRWQKQHPALRMSLNLAGPHLDRPDWVGVIRRAVEAAGVSPVTVDLELTETTRPTGAQTGRAMLHAARAMGFRIWLDDFGSGWSALQDLIRLPVDGLKIDRSFAANLGTQVNDAVIRALTGATGELGLKVTIEGVETPEQAARAADLGCDYAQGFLWSPAVAAADLDGLLPEAVNGCWVSSRTGAAGASTAGYRTPDMERYSVRGQGRVLTS